VPACSGMQPLKVLVIKSLALEVFTPATKLCRSKHP